jgi:hypothetical protein
MTPKQRQYYEQWAKVLFVEFPKHQEKMRAEAAAEKKRKDQERFERLLREQMFDASGRHSHPASRMSHPACELSINGYRIPGVIRLVVNTGQPQIYASIVHVRDAIQTYPGPPTYTLEVEIHTDCMNEFMAAFRGKSKAVMEIKAYPRGCFTCEGIVQGTAAGNSGGSQYGAYCTVTVLIKPRRTLGFTGSRHGMTNEQRKAFIELICGLTVVEFHHGDCKGADAQAHAVIRQYASGARIVGHPPIDDRWRAFCKCDELLPCYEYLQRNRHIVGDVQAVVGTPSGPPSTRGSGTWYTLRYAIEQGVQTFVIQPNGGMEVT